ncbi:MULTISPECIES: RHS repeat-associated core domain-containing protein [Burkholderia cepacia complex]|uniref:RHS repeat-associated core domain-containing protein n=1 Tax=Burkholderia cepacia complex TaxID=87882 RepID=UPI0028D314A9|nr:RHS repeat-associated core domain-containing protein [Burkholderia aenigmatica]
MPGWGEVQLASATSVHVPRRQNLRVQLQCPDRQIGLHYNTLGLYDPDIDRFINPDEIGLNGGHDLYAYAESSQTQRGAWVTKRPRTA